MDLVDPEETTHRDFDNFQEQRGVCGVRVRVVWRPDCC